MGNQTCTTSPQIGQVWRQSDGYLCRIVAITDEWVWVRHISGKGLPIQVNLAWFKEWGFVS